MRLRVLLEPRHGAAYEQILALARVTEDAGFDAFFRSDHYLGADAADASYLPTDSWTTIAGLARETTRVRLGTLMTASTFRYPGPLAVTVATADVMSGGRVELGIGAAWYGREHQSFGIPFPAIGERFDRLEEQLSVLTGLWSTPEGERYSFEGKHLLAIGATCRPLVRAARQRTPRFRRSGRNPGEACRTGRRGAGGLARRHTPAARQCRHCPERRRRAGSRRRARQATPAAYLPRNRLARDP